MSDSLKRLAILLAILVIVMFAPFLVSLLDMERIGKSWRGFWSGEEVAVVYNTAVERVTPLQLGPVQELAAGWVEAAPELDGALAPGEWDGAAVVEIDGIDRVRPGLATGQREITTERAASGTIPFASSHAAIYAMNDAEAVYIAVDVTDDHLDFREGDLAKRDSIEFHVREGSWESPAAGEVNDYFLLLLGDGLKWVGGLPDGEYAARVKSDGSGYVVEVQWRCEQVDTIGFDVGINDRDDPDPEQRASQYYWNGSPPGRLKEGRELGRLILADPV